MNYDTNLQVNDNILLSGHLRLGEMFEKLS